MSDHRALPYSISPKTSGQGEIENDDKNDEFDMKRNLIVNYLPHTLSQEDVKLMFCRIGEVTNCKLIRNHETHQSLGYAFIEYPTAQLAEQAIEKIDGIQIQGKTLKVSYARQSSPDIKNSNVYIAGLPSWVTEDQLQSLFSPFGQVITHKLLYNADNTCRGVGFVRYSLKTSAENAIRSMNGKQLPEASVALTVKLAIPPASKQQNAMLNTATAQTNVVATAGFGRGSVRYNPLAPNPMLVNQISAQPMNRPLGEPSAGSLTGGFLPNPVNRSPAVISQHPAGQVGQVFSIYVYGLQPTHTELNLFELFAPFGAILNVKLIRDLTKEEKPCKGFGFINFRKYDEAYNAVITMNNCPFEGKNLQVSFKQSKHGNQAMS